MRKILFVLAVLCAAYSAFPASGFAYKWTIADGDTVTKTKWKANNDSVLNWAARIADTINATHLQDSIKTLINDSTKTRSVRGVKAKYDSTFTADSLNVRAIGGGMITMTTDSITAMTDRKFKMPAGFTNTNTAILSIMILTNAASLWQSLTNLNLGSSSKSLALYNYGAGNDSLYIYMPLSCHSAKILLMKY